MRIATRQVANQFRLAVIPTATLGTTFAATCFFDRRFKGSIRAFGFPKIPRTFAASGSNPSNR